MTKPTYNTNSRLTSRYLVLLVTIIGLQACVEPYPVETGLSFEQALVVDARFTDQKIAHYVKLSQTRQIDAFEPIAVTGATVWIESSEGENIVLQEVEVGIYLTDSSVAGIPGHTYELHFITADGKEYHSSEEYLQASPPIDDITLEYAERANSDDEVTGGIQFFLSTHDETGNARYFKYEWEETYEVHTSYPSFFEYDYDLDSAISRA